MTGESQRQALGDALAEAAQRPYTIEGHIGGRFFCGGGLDQLQGAFAALHACFICCIHGLQSKLAIHSDGLWGGRLSSPGR